MHGKQGCPSQQAGEALSSECLQNQAGGVQGKLSLGPAWLCLTWWYQQRMVLGQWGSGVYCVVHALEPDLGDSRLGSTAH